MSDVETIYDPTDDKVLLIEGEPEQERYLLCDSVDSVTVEEHR